MTARFGAGDAAVAIVVVQRQRIDIHLRPRLLLGFRTGCGRAFGHYRTKDMVLAYYNALAAGDTSTDVAV